MSEVSLHTKISGSKTRKQSSRVYNLSKKDLLAVTEHAPDVICRFDTAFRLLYVNPAIELATGIPTAAFLNKTTRELGMPDEHSSNWEEKISFVITTGQSATLEFPFLTPSGLRFFHSVLAPEFSDDGRVETVLSISRDITEKKELDKKKEEAVSFVSHELKTPVTSLKLSTQVLKQKFARGGDAYTAAHLDRMDKQIDKLTNIIGDLMDTTRIEQGALKLQKEEFDMNILVKETVEEVQKTSPQHSIVILGKSERSVCADRFRIGQVITNLLTNAIRYSPDAADIQVTIEATNKEITISVRDHGIGIPKEQQKRIFERFYRVEDIEQAFHMGLGLGLYISSEIVKQHHGKIWVTSEFGKGSTFSFTLSLL